MTRLAHISDLHFGHISEGTVQYLLDDLHEVKPDYLLVSGDITQGARTNEFREAAKFFARVPGRTFIVPGNHDIPGWAVWRRMLRPYNRYQRFISEDINPVHMDDNLLLVGINTARRVVYDLNWSHGRVSRSQFELLREMSARAGDVPKIAMFHHPLIPPPPGVPQKRVARARAFARALSEAGFDFALSGHLHTARITRVSEIYDDIGTDLYAIEAGTATSSRLRNRPNEYNVIELNSNNAAISVRSFLGNKFVSESPLTIAI